MRINVIVKKLLLLFLRIVAVGSMLLKQSIVQNKFVLSDDEKVKRRPASTWGVGCGLEDQCWMCMNNLKLTTKTWHFIQLVRLSCFSLCKINRSTINDTSSKMKCFHMLQAGYLCYLTCIIGRYAYVGTGLSIEVKHTVSRLCKAKIFLSKQRQPSVQLVWTESWSLKCTNHCNIILEIVKFKWRLNKVSWSTKTASLELGGVIYQ